MAAPAPLSDPAALSELAALVGGHLVGDATLELTGAAPLGEAGPGDITLVDHADRLPALAECAAAAVVVPKGVAVDDRPSIAVDDLHAAFSAIVLRFRPTRRRTLVGRHAGATIDPSAQIDPTAQIHCGAVIGEDVTIGPRTTVYPNTVILPGCRVGADVTIFPSATLYEDTNVGDRCIVHAGAVIGAYGFGYSQSEGRHVLAAQLGNVEVEDDVEIGAGTTIDRGVYGPTRIGEGTKIDNLAQIAHNCRIGKHNLICSQVGIAGSTTTGDYVVMAGQAGVRDHVTIGTGAQLGAMCGVSHDIPAGESVLGAPAVPVKAQKLRFAAIAKLPEMRKEFKQLRKQVAELAKQLDASEATQPQPREAA